MSQTDDKKNELQEVIEWLESYANVEENVRRIDDEPHPTRGMPTNLRRAVALLKSMSARSAIGPTDTELKHYRNCKRIACSECARIESMSPTDSRSEP